MTDFSYNLKIPKERVAVLIGKKGEVKKNLEEATKTKINIDSDDGTVTVTGEDALLLFSLREIIKAIGRGFNPEIAMFLLKQDYVLEMLFIPDYISNKNQLARIKGRVIGEDGKARRIIEQLTEVHMSIFGKTISILGFADNVMLAKKAVESLIAGSKHSTIYRWLEKQRAELKMADFRDKK